MSEHTWNDTYDQAVRLFGETCGAALEQEIINLWEREPVRAETELRSLGAQIKHGANINSPWHVWKSRLLKAPAERKTSDATEKVKRIANARSWIHNAGLHYDLERDVLDELFGTSGMLNAYDTPQLRAEMSEAWTQERPRGERTEAEADAYQRRVSEAPRRIQWDKARKAEQRWATQDASFDEYETARKAGKRPYWAP